VRPAEPFDQYSRPEQDYRERYPVRSALHRRTRMGSPRGEDTARIGITDFAQSALGDVVFVQLPDVGAEVSTGETFGEVESTKSVSDLYAPVSGKVSAVNSDLEGSPDLVNSDPYGAGWLVDVKVSDPAELQSAIASLLDAEPTATHSPNDDC